MEADRSVMARRARARARLAAGVAAFVVALALALTAAAWLSGAFSGGYSSPQGLAKAYVEAYLARDPARLCACVSPADRTEMERSSKRAGGPGSCAGIMAATLKATSHPPARPDELRYGVEATSRERARVVVTRAGAPYDTVDARRDQATARWFLDLDVSGGDSPR